jgi:SAM-dependent methyltransferase
MRPCICGNINKDIVYNLDLMLPNDIILNNNIKVKYCNDCKFYYSDCGNTQETYDNYYTKFNNYSNQNYCIDKDEKCKQFIMSFLPFHLTILDYGSGNGILSNLLKNDYKVSEFDIGMECIEEKFDCVILSHVLEHIYDLDNFIQKVSINIKQDGYLYIEVPNGEFYNKIVNICPLQEINLEHINFFSKIALQKLLCKHEFYCSQIMDDFFILNNDKYFVIRAVFKKHESNFYMDEYISQGIEKINSYRFNDLENIPALYLFGCGQFLFKILKSIIAKTNILGIVDDNPCYQNNYIQEIPIINFKQFSQIVKNNDNILITSLIHNLVITKKLQTLGIQLNILNIFD